MMLLQQKLVEPLRICYRVLMDAKFDLLNGVDTSGIVMGDHLATPARKIVAALRSLPIDFREYTLVDLGCGKGRVLLVGRRFAFREIIGVEISERLSRVAAENTRKFSNVSVLACDATSYALPNGPCVVYMGNPFMPKAMEVVLQNIEQRLERDGSPIYVIYVVPDFRELLDKAAFLKSIPSPGYCAVYVTRQAGSKAAFAG